MPAAKWSDEEKAKAIAVYRSDGLDEAAAQTGIPRGTISSLVSRAGIQSNAPEKLRAANEMLGLTRVQKQELLADLMLDEAIQTVKDMSLPITVAGAFAPVELPKPNPKHRKELAITLGVLFDKVQLATGGATSRNEQVDRSEKEAKLARALRVVPKSA